MNAVPNVAIDASSAVLASPPAKNSSGKTDTAAVAKM